MRPDTRLIQTKYKDFNYILFNERHHLFKITLFENSIDDNVYDNEKYYDFQFEVLFKYKVMMDMWHQYLSYQSVLKKRFIKKRDKIKKKAYRDLLTSVFCFDIANEITNFIL